MKLFGNKGDNSHDQNQPTENGKVPDKDLEKLKEAMKSLGIEMPAEGEVVQTVSGSFMLTPNGIEGGEMLATMLHNCWLSARSSGCPRPLLEAFAHSLLGGFALAIANTLAGDDEVISENPLALTAAVMDQTTEERADLAATLCDQTSESLRSYSTWVDEQEQKKEEEKSEPLVDFKAAAELRRLFEESQDPEQKEK